MAAPEQGSAQPRTTGERVTLNLKPGGQRALHNLRESTGDNTTDVINRALLLYGKVVRTQAEGGQLILTNPQGEKEIVTFI